LVGIFARFAFESLRLLADLALYITSARTLALIRVDVVAPDVPRAELPFERICHREEKESAAIVSNESFSCRTQCSPTRDCPRPIVDGLTLRLRDDWPAALTQVGFDPAEPAAWIAEGLLGYLPAEAPDRLLDQITAPSAPGSGWLPVI